MKDEIPSIENRVNSYPSIEAIKALDAIMDCTRKINNLALDILLASKDIFLRDIEKNNY